jgi:hypothetical protein
MNIVDLIIRCSTTTLIIVLGNIWIGCKRSFLFYALLFVAIFMSLFVCEKAFTNECELIQYDSERHLTIQQRQQLLQKIKDHILMGYKWLDQAEQQAYLIPDWDVQHVTLTTIESTVAVVVTCASAGAQFAALAGLAVWCHDYLKWAYVNWENINHCVLSSKHNFEMAAFYQDVIFNDGVK